MSKKDGQSQQTLKSETSRRTFLKTGAVVAGAAMIGSAVKASSASTCKEAIRNFAEPVISWSHRRFRTKFHPPNIWYKVKIKKAWAVNVNPRFLRHWFRR
jgi:hypothetical protein